MLRTRPGALVPCSFSLERTLTTDVTVNVQQDRVALAFCTPRAQVWQASCGFAAHLMQHASLSSSDLVSHKPVHWLTGCSKLNSPHKDLHVLNNASIRIGRDKVALQSCTFVQTRRLFLKHGNSWTYWRSAERPALLLDSN